MKIFNKSDMEETSVEAILLDFLAYTIFKKPHLSDELDECVTDYLKNLE